MHQSVSADTGQWQGWLCQGAQEVFEMMVGVSLHLCPQQHAANGPGGFTAVIGLAGPVNGVLAMRCNEPSAIAIAQGMLGAELSANEAGARAEICDALGEVCNMVAGNFKAKTGRAGETSVLSVPTVIHGSEYRVRPLIDGSCLECRMETPNGSLHLRLDYRLTCAPTSLAEGTPLA